MCLKNTHPSNTHCIKRTACRQSGKPHVDVGDERVQRGGGRGGRAHDGGLQLLHATAQRSNVVVVLLPLVLGLTQLVAATDRLLLQDGHPLVQVGQGLLDQAVALAARLRQQAVGLTAEGGDLTLQ